MRAKLILSGLLVIGVTLALVAWSPSVNAMGLTCDVTVDDNGGVGVYSAIQAGIDAALAGNTICVYPGTYNEFAPGSSPTTIAGTYQFGLFFPSSKPGLKLVGVDAGGNEITEANFTLATINTNATNNFGYSGIFVEAANTTIQGVKIGPNTDGDNKTVEVVADNFSLKNVKTDISGGGSIYINDFSSDGNVVKSYHILNNIFSDSTTVDLSSGAGSTGDISGREVIGNTFDALGNNWTSISFNGSETGVPWYTNTVGGAIIKNNNFYNGQQYIRARGTYDNSQFDWKSYWLDNTYNKAVIDLVTETPFDVRTYSYSSAPYTFNNVRRIGGVIQQEIDHAQAGDTLLIKAGNYPEDVVVNKANLTVRGEGMDSTVIMGQKNGSINTLEIPAGAINVLVDSIKITRDGNSITDWNNANGILNNQGIAIYAEGTTLQNSKVTGNRNGVFIYGATNVSLKNNTIDFNRTGIHLVNNVTGLLAINNFITNNWTMGILFRDESSSNPTGQVTINNNDISGNWYSQVEARSAFSNPAFNVTKNWLGTQNPSLIGAATSSEPAYSAQIPEVYGGSSVSPSSSPTVIWNNNVNAVNPVNYKPFLCVGVDISAAIGFQPAAYLSSQDGVCLSPTNKEQCKYDGWKLATYPRKYKNQGDCVSYFASGDKAKVNPPIPSNNATY